METKLKQEPVADGTRFVDQTRFGYPDGNCFAACVAAILSLPLADMPTVSVVKDFDCTWREWLKRRGLGMVDVPSGTGEHIAGYCIAFGDSPRGGLTISQHPVSHAVVCRDMELVHDPHPSRAFLDGIPKGYTVFYNLNSEPVADGGGMPSLESAEDAWKRGYEEGIQEAIFNETGCRLEMVDVPPYTPPVSPEGSSR